MSNLKQSEDDEIWTVVVDSALWESGPARALYPLTVNANTLGKRIMPAFFVGRESARKFTEKLGIEAVKPFRLTTNAFVALIADLHNMGVVYVAKIPPGATEQNCEVGSIESVLATISKATSLPRLDIHVTNTNTGYDA